MSNRTLTIGYMATGFPLLRSSKPAREPGVKFQSRSRMKPVVKVRSTDQDEWLNSILDVITNFQCEGYFYSHLGQPQHMQKLIVNSFQQSLCQQLIDSIPSLKWTMEYAPSNNQKDSIDIFGESEGFVVVIELDKSRADQVAKKFVSRVALMPDKKVYFLSLCYPGTEKMNVNECVKYFGYCSNLAKRMSGVYAGLVIGKI